MGSFNGRFYDGGYSGHDVNGRDYIGEQIRNTLSQVYKLQGVKFLCGSYDSFEMPRNSVIYCDIPYNNTYNPTEKLFVHESIANKYMSNELKLF